MKDLKVKDLLVPFSQCPKVSQDATLRDAVLSLEATRLRGDPWEYRPRVILVHDSDERIVGTIRHFEVLRALEPKYTKVVESLDDDRRSVLESLHSTPLDITDKTVLFTLGLDADKVKYLMEEFHLWEDPLRELGRRAAVLRVRDIMTVPGEGEMIDSEAPLNKAIHQLLMGNYLSLVVHGPEGFRGILRLSDVFNEACSAIKLSEL